ASSSSSSSSPAAPVSPQLGPNPNVSAANGSPVTSSTNGRNGGTAVITASTATAAPSTRSGPTAAGRLPLHGPPPASTMQLPPRASLLVPCQLHIRVALACGRAERGFFCI